MAFIPEVLDYDDPSTACNQLYPFHSQPRAEAGMPLIADGLKCELAEPVRDEYPAMSDEQWDRLLAVFPTGVCDWSQRPQGVTELEGTWLDFGTTERVNASVPVIEGVPRVGETLTALIDVPDGAVVAYQWVADGTPIDGAVDASFAPTPDLIGVRVQVRATVSVDGYVSRTLVSDPTNKVVRATGKP
jgi:hypothetical protein